MLVGRSACRRHPQNANFTWVSFRSLLIANRKNNGHDQQNKTSKTKNKKIKRLSDTQLSQQLHLNRMRFVIYSAKCVHIARQFTFQLDRMRVFVAVCVWVCLCGPYWKNDNWLAFSVPNIEQSTKRFISTKCSEKKRKKYVHRKCGTECTQCARNALIWCNCWLRHCCWILSMAHKHKILRCMDCVRMLNITVLDNVMILCRAIRWFFFSIFYWNSRSFLR